MATDHSQPGNRRSFPSTCWSRILGRGAAPPDLSELASCYWRPVYGYIRTRWSLSADDARDRTQDFFLWVLEHDAFGRADPQRGSFRSFLKATLHNFLVGADRKDRAQKRGGDRVRSLALAGEALPELDVPDLRGRPPDEVLDELWRRALVERATAALEQELRSQGKDAVFDVFRDYFLSPEPDLDYAQVAQRYGLTQAQVSNHLMFAKKRYRALLRASVLETVAGPDILEDELRWLLGSNA